MPCSGLKRRTPSSVESDEPSATLCGTMSGKWAAPFFERTAESVIETPSCTCAFAVDCPAARSCAGASACPLNAVPIATTVSGLPALCASEAIAGVICATLVWEPKSGASSSAAFWPFACDGS